jgi:aminopeptidase N
MRALVSGVLAAGLLSLAAAAHGQAYQPQTLPPEVVPLSYDLRLHPDAAHLAFSAEVLIPVEVKAQVPAIVLNALGLTFDRVTLEDGRLASVSLDPQLERASLAFAGGVAPGRHVLDIRYHGPIAGGGTLGFFAMDYDTASGHRRTLATNFEPASGRMFMPSWDEPGRKAPLALTVDAPKGQMVVANMPQASEDPLPGGMKRVRFRTTPRMSTYLFFLAIGDFERITSKVDGVTVGVVVPRGEAARGRYALGEAVRLLHYYDGWFGVRFPLPKLDLVAAPGVIDGGAMENWGAIFYSQQDLLFDPATSTDADRQNVVAAVAHEMAHQWFGDLVTMRWWDNLWLNEGFARWMETKAADVLHPQWQSRLQAAAITERGMRADAAPATHPVEQPVRTAADAELAFDRITYDKGASVIGMLEAYVGAERFRQGIAHYMQAHAFGNAVSDDLWRALEASSGKPVLDVAQGFTRREGLPLVTVAAEQPAAGGTRLGLAQDRFYEQHFRDAASEPAVQPWRIPLGLRPAAGGAETATVLGAGHAEVTAAGPAPIVANAGRLAYARVRYQPAVFDALLPQLASLPAMDQIALVQDSWALGQSGYAPAVNVLKLVDRLPPGADPLAWDRAIAILVDVDRLYDGLPGQAGFRRWARTRLEPVAARVGWRPVKDETSEVGSLRGPLLKALSRFDDEPVIAEARRIAARLDVPPATARIARQVVDRHADAATFDKAVAAVRATPDPLQKQRMLEDLAPVADPALAGRLLELIAGPDAPAGTRPRLLLLTAQDHPGQTWDFVKAHIDAPGFAPERDVRMGLLSVLSTASDAARVADMRAFAAARLPPEATRPVAATSGHIELNAHVREAELPKLDAWLAAAAPPG